MKNGLIYKIKSKNENVLMCYIGSTENLTQRQTKHKSNCYNVNSPAYNRKFYKYMRDNGGYDSFIFIILQDNILFNEREELNKIEGKYIIECENNLNSHIAGRTRKECIKEYRKTDKYKAYKKEYQKEYRNTDQFKEYHKMRAIPFICECGASTSKKHFVRHCKSKKHIDFIKS